LSRGSSPCGYPHEPLVSYQINRQLSGWILPPLMIRAFGAHCQEPTYAVQQIRAALRSHFDLNELSTLPGRRTVNTEPLARLAYNRHIATIIRASLRSEQHQAGAIASQCGQGNRLGELPEQLRRS
jgi:hypothetical protein